MKWVGGEEEYFKNNTQKNSSIILTSSNQPTLQYSYLLFSSGRNFTVLFPWSLLKEKAQSCTCKLPGGKSLIFTPIEFVKRYQKLESVLYEVMFSGNCSNTKITQPNSFGEDENLCREIGTYSADSVLSPFQILLPVNAEGLGRTAGQLF